ncbi:hypothetical protein Dimus_000126 [Dionaea muscipula]
MIGKRMMEGNKENEPVDSSTPKLNLALLARHKPPQAEPPGMVTPPLQAMVSVPFLWEEAPGRPRLRPNHKPSNSCGSSPLKPKSARCLELPPGLSTEAHGPERTSSPMTTVLDGSELGRASSRGTLGIGLGEKAKVRITSFRITRKSSCFLTSLAHATSHLLDRVYGRFKQMVVPRTWKQETGAVN